MVFISISCFWAASPICGGGGGEGGKGERRRGGREGGRKRKYFIEPQTAKTAPLLYGAKVANQVAESVAVNIAKKVSCNKVSSLLNFPPVLPVT